MVQRPVQSLVQSLDPYKIKGQQKQCRHVGAARRSWQKKKSRIRINMYRQYRQRLLRTRGTILSRCWCQPALGCESNWVKSTHDAYENTWKCGELKLYSAPSARGWKKKGIHVLVVLSELISYAFLPVFLVCFPLFFPTRTCTHLLLTCIFSTRCYLCINHVQRCSAC